MVQWLPLNATNHMKFDCWISNSPTRSAKTPPVDPSSHFYRADSVTNESSKTPKVCAALTYFSLVYVQVQSALKRATQLLGSSIDMAEANRHNRDLFVTTKEDVVSMPGSVEGQARPSQHHSASQRLQLQDAGISFFACLLDLPGMIPMVLHIARPHQPACQN